MGRTAIRQLTRGLIVHCPESGMHGTWRASISIAHEPPAESRAVRIHSSFSVYQPGESVEIGTVDIRNRGETYAVFRPDGNVEAAARLGMQAIHFRDAGQLRRELAGRGVAIAAAEAAR